MTSRWIAAAAAAMTLGMASFAIAQPKDHTPTKTLIKDRHMVEHHEWQLQHEGHHHNHPMSTLGADRRMVEQHEWALQHHGQPMPVGHHHHHHM